MVKPELTAIREDRLAFARVQMGCFGDMEGRAGGLAQGFKGYFEGVPWPMPGNMPRQQAAIGCRRVRAYQMEVKPRLWFASEMPQRNDVRMSSTDQEDAH